MRVKMAVLGMALVLAAPASFASAPAPNVITLTLNNHRFIPSSVNASAGERIRIVLVNQDAATEEFDSHDLRVEQLVTPYARVSFEIGPLAPGRYAFMGEFHPETAQGLVTVAAVAH